MNIIPSSNKKDRKLKNWLNKKLDTYTEGTLTAPIKNFQTSGVYDKEEYELYYGKNDIDEQMNIKYAENINYENKGEEYYTSSVEEYGDKRIVIPQNTKRAHCSYLFKLLVNTSLEEELYVKTPKIEKEMISYYEYPIFDKTMKEKFYQFCMKNSLK